MWPVRSSTKLRLSKWHERACLTSSFIHVYRIVSRACSFFSFSAASLSASFRPAKACKNLQSRIPAAQVQCRDLVRVEPGLAARGAGGRLLVCGYGQRAKAASALNVILAHQCEGRESLNVEMTTALISKHTWRSQGESLCRVWKVALWFLGRHLRNFGRFELSLARKGPRQTGELFALRLCGTF